MLQELTFNPVTLLLLIPVVAWAVWAVRRLVGRGLCDCHGSKRSRKGAKSSGACAHCSSATCPAASMASKLDAIDADATSSKTPAGHSG